MMRHNAGARRPAQHQRAPVATRRGAYPHTDDGVAVRRIFHELRSRASENFNGQFKGIFDCARPVPTKGLVLTQRHVLGANAMSWAQ
jgi:hypothetical protein